MSRKIKKLFPIFIIIILLASVFAYYYTQEPTILNKNIPITLTTYLPQTQMSVGQMELPFCSTEIECINHFRDNGIAESSIQQYLVENIVCLDGICYINDASVIQYGG